MLPIELEMSLSIKSIEMVVFDRLTTSTHLKEPLLEKKIENLKQFHKGTIDIRPVALFPKVWGFSIKSVGLNGSTVLHLKAHSTLLASPLALLVI